MGNCQAIDAATLVIQQPGGKSDKIYWPVSAAEVMKSNPGHYVARLVSSTLCESSAKENQVRVTRIKLMRSTDTLELGQVYRLITDKEVMKVLSAKKQAKRMRQGKERSVEEEQDVDKQKRQSQQKPTTSPSTIGRPRSWQPSLRSISEAVV